MPKLLNSVPKYRLHRASRQAIVTLCGKDFYLGPHGSKVSRDAYDRLTAEWLTNGRRLPNEELAAISVNELLAAFWQHANDYYVGLDGKPTKEVDSYKQAMKPLRSLYGETLVDDFGPLRLKTVRDVFLKAGRARKFINQQIGRIKRIFKWGVENELVTPSIFQALQAVSGLKKGRSEAKDTLPITSVSQTTVEAIQPFVSRQVWAMVQLQLLTGMRSGEVTAMRGIDISRNGETWEYRPAFHKTAYRGRERVVILGPKAKAVVSCFLVEKEENEYLFSPIEAVAERNLLKRSARKSPMTPSQAARKPKKTPKTAPGERYTTDSYGRAIKYAIKQAKSATWSPHQLRHTAATRIRSEHGLEAAQVVLGHSKADVTQIYAEANISKATEVMKLIG